MALRNKDNNVKTDNHPIAEAAKVTIRRNVMTALGAPAHVFDAFGGSGHMHAQVWKDAASYIGCDLKWSRDARAMFVADNRRVLRAIDLGRFNVFDLDAYGSPWEQAVIVADRRPVKRGERIGLAITEGSGFAYKSNIVPHVVRQLTGLRPGIVGLSKKQDAIVDRLLTGLARRMRCTIEKRWQAKGRTGAAMVYTGVVLVGE